MPLLKPIQKMPNSHLKMLKQQHFLYQRKNLYDQEPSRSSSGETVPEQDYKIPWLEFLTFIPPHRTLSEVTALPRVKLGIPAAAPGGHHCNMKSENQI